MSDSIAFYRAAEYYDDTRGLSEEGVRHTTEALAEVFRGGGPILEVGVGTGQVALPLHDAGVPVMGVDLSRPMLSKLLAKAGGALPFPLVEGDAASLPFTDDAFGGAYLRWVLHL
ncbi:MAG TPA: class I SAM-dependent methyltransferase, partial [Actinomycetota bacterium]|nr:class I SAM-dependent methyltransferase [Actinomycetota bacterium]